MGMGVWEGVTAGSVVGVLVEVLVGFGVREAVADGEGVGEICAIAVGGWVGDGSLGGLGVLAEQPVSSTRRRKRISLRRGGMVLVMGRSR